MEPGAAEPRPFTAADVVSLGSLAAALHQLVFQHPEVIRLRAVVMAKGKHFYEDAGLIVPVYGHDHHFVALRSVQTDPAQFRLDKAATSKPEPNSAWGTLLVGPGEDVEALYSEINMRFQTLFGMLSRREIVAVGYAGNARPVAISPAIWSHEEFFVHPVTGDIYQAVPGAMKRWWTGTALALPRDARPPAIEGDPPAHNDRQHRLKAPKRRPRSEAIALALEKAGIDLGSSKLSNKQIAGLIASLIPDPPKTASQLDALAKAISRLRQSR